MISRLVLATVAALVAAPLAFAGEVGKPWWSWTPFGVEQPKWDGQYLLMSTGFEVTSFRGGRTYGGPTLGVEAGKMWRDGDFVYGVAGAFRAMKPFVSGTNNSAFADYYNDFAGTAKVKFGYLANPNLLLYTTVGVSAWNENWRYPQWAGGGTDTRFAAGPEVAAGFEWALSDNTRIWGEIRAAAPVR